MGCGQKVKCGDGICHRSEYRQNSCSADCKEISVIINDSKPPILSPPDEPIVYDNNSPIASVCGDGICETSETEVSCPADCERSSSGGGGGGSGSPPAQSVCGDGSCSSDETEVSCPADCVTNPVIPPVCGDGSCSSDETEVSCPADCKPVIPICIDNDGDDYGNNCSLGLDCDDSDSSIHPGALDVCDGVDDNCALAETDCVKQSDSLYISCNNLGTGSERCFWRYDFDPSKCSPNCDKLVIFFGGGGMNCDTEGYATDKVIEYYKNHGYIATCVDIFETGEAAGAYHFVDEAGRVDRLVEDITSFVLDNHVWSGKHLLISGVSHGATAPVIAMARTSFDEQSSWHGSETTGACFYDGIYHTDAVLEFIIENECTGVLDWLSYDRYVGRYCDPLPVFPAVCNNFYSDSALDDMVTPPVSTSNFYIKDWKMMSCGTGAANACYREVSPRVSTEEMCSIIDSGIGSCEFEDLPYSQGYDHLNCAIERVDLCQEWFDDLIS